MKDWRLRNANGQTMFGRPLDIDYDQNGEITFVEKMLMLDQNLKKITMTQFGSSALNPQYGTAIASLTGTKLDPVMTGSLIVGEIERVVTYMKTMMMKQTRATPQERIAFIDDILVDSVSSDPRKLLVTTLVRTEDENSVQMQTTVQPF